MKNLSTPPAAFQAPVQQPGTTSVQRKQLEPPAVYRPIAVAAPGVYRANAGAPIQRSPGLAPPPVYRPQAAVVQPLMIGSAANHHLHVGPGVHQPHYKQGNNNASRVNFGHNQTYTLPGLEATIDVLSTRLGEAGAQACYNWCLTEAQSQDRSARRRARHQIRRMERSGRPVPAPLRAAAL